MALHQLVLSCPRGALLPAFLLCCAELRSGLALDLHFRASESNDTSSNSTRGAALSPEAIANITATCVGVCVITGLLCYLLAAYNRQERMTRVRTALERNRCVCVASEKLFCELKIQVDDADFIRPAGRLNGR